MERLEQIRDLQKKIAELHAEERKLLLEDDKEFLEKAKVNVGRCFFNTTDHVWIKVIGVPVPEVQYLGYRLNRYQYPAIFIDTAPENIKDTLIPFYQDTIFSGVWGEGSRVVDKEYIEIPHLEFDEQFAKVVKQFTELVLDPRKDIFIGNFK